VPSAVTMVNAPLVRNAAACLFSSFMNASKGGRRTHVVGMHAYRQVIVLMRWRLGLSLASCQAFHANRWLLCDRKVSLQSRLRLFASLVTPVACFAFWHRTIYSDSLTKMDVEFRKLVRQIVGPPGNTDWTQPWHEILHMWNIRVRHMCQQAGIRQWSEEHLRQYWNLAAYVLSLSRSRWVRRVLAWQPLGTRAQGRPAHQWETKAEQFCRWHGLGEWTAAAERQAEWHARADDFVSFAR